ncbi:MAG: RNA-binding S4 domain-containing protein [Rhodospirillales bacterium]|nr:RNA-binding S4 domain-containing protein [Rhodospirillales bacterium]
MNADSPPTQRLDKWLWCARFFRSRSLAARLCNEGRLRIAGRVVAKAHYALKPGDVLTFPYGTDIRVVRVATLAKRRGPAAEARGLYEDLALAMEKAADPAADPAIAVRESGAGRPTKAERRALERLRGER